jgi:hypothetical protein
MPSQKWRKKSEHSRKNATFADCFERVMPTDFLWIASCLAMTQSGNKEVPRLEVPKSRIKTINN